MVSSGFLQLTLQHGKLQKWIRAAPEAFARYGIAVDAHRTYTWGDTPQPAIVGAADRDELRWDGWIERFYLSGLDDDVVVAECAVAAGWLDAHLAGMSRRFRTGGMEWAVAAFRAHYDRSPYVRGMFQSSYNNHPRAAQRAGVEAMRADREAGGLSAERFVARYAQAMLDSYTTEGLKERGAHIVERTRTGLRR